MAAIQVLDYPLRDSSEVREYIEARRMDIWYNFFKIKVLGPHDLSYNHWIATLACRANEFVFVRLPKKEKLNSAIFFHLLWSSLHREPIFIRSNLCKQLYREYPWYQVKTEDEIIDEDILWGHMNFFMTEFCSLIENHHLERTPLSTTEIRNILRSI